MNHRSGNIINFNNFMDCFNLENRVTYLDSSERTHFRSDKYRPFNFNHTECPKRLSVI